MDYPINEIFNIRDGVIDYGKDYEFLVAAYYGLKFALDDSVTDFRLSTNNNDLGDFDDVVVELELANNVKRLYALQLKHHANSKSISFTSMSGNSGNFSLKRYCNEFNKIKDSKPNNFDNFRFILYTNSFLPPLVQRCGKEDVQVAEMLMPNSQITVTKKSGQLTENDEMCLFDTSNGENSIYQFRGGEIDSEFLEKFALFTNQMHARDVEKTIREVIMNLCGDVNVFTNLLVYFKYWCRGDYGCFKLSKYDIRIKLAELILHPYILSLSFDVKKNKKAKLFEEAVKCFDVTVIENLNVNFISDVVVEDSDLLKKFGLLPNQNLLKSWYLNLVPLVVRYNETVRIAMELCNYKDKRKKFLLNCYSHGLSKDWNVFSTFSDVSNDLYDRIAENFQISLQDRQTVSIKDLLDLNNALNITATELLQMVDGPLHAGELKSKLPEYYVSRTVPKVILEINVLNCEGLFVIDGSDIAKTREVIKEATLVHIDDYLILKDVKPSSHILNKWNMPKKLVVFCNERAKFNQLLSASSESVIHYLRFIDDCCLEWLWSKGKVNELVSFRKYDHGHLIKDNKIFDHFTNDLNIFCADPGMGKSVMLNFLEANAPNGHWSLKIDLNDHFEFFKNSVDLDLFTYFLEATNDFDKKIAESFAKAGRVIVLWDSFDELPEDAAKAAIGAVRKFQKYGFKQVIAGRVFHSEMLENDFETFALTLTQFSEADQKDYAYNKLKDKCDPGTFEMILSKMYENIAMLSGFDSGVPLQTYMLTEIFCGNPKEFLNEKIVTTTDIYRNFIEGKFNYFYDKVRAENNYSMLQLRENYKKMRLKLYEIAALQACLDWLDFTELKLDSTELLDDIKLGRDNLGLIVKVSDEGIAVFAHKTYAEFLTAFWFSCNVKHVHILFKENLRAVRLMFDIILARNSLAHLAVLYKNLELLRRCEDFTCKDPGGRSALHIAASWGVTRKLIKSENFIDVTVAKEDPRHLVILINLLEHNDPFAVDSIHQWDSIDYADKSLSLSSLEIISKKFDFDLNKLKNCDKLTLCYYSVKFKYESLFNRVDTVPYAVFAGKRNLLFTAVENNALSFIPKLLKIYDVNATDIIHTTPLYLAAERGYHQMVLLLLENGAKINNITYPPLCGGVCNIRICEELIERGANVNECDGRLISPLMNAVLTKSPNEVVRLLLQHEANVNYATKNDTVLHFAAGSSQSSEVIELLIAHGANANVKNNRGNTPLLVALENENFAVAKSLIRHSNLDAHNHDGFCALFMATLKGNEGMVKILLENGAKTDCTEDQLPVLHLAVFNDMKGIVEDLLEAGANVNGSTSDGETALWLVKSVDMLELLISHGINVNYCNKKGISDISVPILPNSFVEGQTALHYACLAGYLDVAKTLIQHILKINTSSDDLLIDGSVNKNEPALLFNAAAHSFECLQLLLDHGVDINAQNLDGVAAIHTAAATGVGLKNLQRASSTLDPNIVTKDGCSPLFIAALSGLSNVVQELINIGAEVNGLKENPLHLSCLNGDIVLVLILLRAGSNVNAYWNGTTPIFCTGLEILDFDCSDEIRGRLSQRQLAQIHLDCTLQQRRLFKRTDSFWWRC